MPRRRRNPVPTTLYETENSCSTSLYQFLIVARAIMLVASGWGTKAALLSTTDVGYRNVVERLDPGVSFEEIDRSLSEIHGVFVRDTVSKPVSFAVIQEFEDEIDAYDRVAVEFVSTGIYPHSPIDGDVLDLARSSVCFGNLLIDSPRYPLSQSNLLAAKIVHLVIRKIGPNDVLGAGSMKQKLVNAFSAITSIFKAANIV
ncbi:hypothetical protein FRC09_001111 [Ceratobasidium sp. 395]|nr:hypothetical protein FRC09_001111 [Ceratobasidium sp. 395]